MRVFHHGVIEFAAHDEVNVGAGEQTFRGLNLNLRADESDLDAGFLFLHGFRHFQVAIEADGRSEKHYKFVILRNLHNLFGRDVVWRRVQQAAAF